MTSAPHGALAVAPTASAPVSLPDAAGIGLRSQHHVDLVERRPRLAFVEVHSENYFGAGGAPLHYLEKAREHYPLSLHGVGLSIGSAEPTRSATSSSKLSGREKSPQLVHIRL